MATTKRRGVRVPLRLALGMVWSQRRATPRAFVIRTPSAGIVRVGTHNERDARTAVRAYTRARYPLTWRDLYSQGYRVEAIPGR